MAADRDGASAHQSAVIVVPDLKHQVSKSKIHEHNSIKTSKYTVINFIPKSLFEQFRRLANIYFLVLSALMMIGTYAPRTFDSPLTPWSTLLPLCVVLGFTMMKEAFEDYKRHQSDKQTDNRSCTRRLEGSVGTNSNQDEADVTLNDVRWADLRRGHVIRLRNKEAIPADLVILATSEPEGICYVETSNIDGETNLKMRRAVPGLGVWTTNLAKIVAEEPNGRIHTFKGYAKAHGERANDIPIDQTSFLLRGSSVQNVKWVDGIVVYTGRDSKLAKNSAKPRLKLSSVEKTMNRLIRMVFGWLFLMIFVSTGSLLVLRNRRLSQFPYLQGSGDYFSFPTPIAYCFTFLILFSNALPMSLYVTVEMVNFGQAFFIDNDIELYDATSDTPARAVTSNLNSDLGQVEYIFSDKTGTLTQNVMTFRRCSVGGRVFGGPLMQQLSRGQNKTLQWEPLEALASDSRSQTSAFLHCLAVAHTVQIEEDGSLRAESPDERALCEGARSIGCSFVGRSGQGEIHVKDRDGSEGIWRVICVNEFSSARKRMSVLVESPIKECYLFCKGADSVVLSRSNMPPDERRLLESHLSNFADEGLRTLVLAQKGPIPRAQAEAYLKAHSAARASLEEREERVDAAAEEMEQDLEVLGATAIEDKLQEGVPETLEALRAAGIKVWVLTGDKLETAINIGFSSRLLDSTMRIIRVDGKSKEEVHAHLENVVQFVTKNEDRSNSREARPTKAVLDPLLSTLAKSRLARAASWWTKSASEEDRNVDGLCRTGSASPRIGTTSPSTAAHLPRAATTSPNHTTTFDASWTRGQDSIQEPLLRGETSSSGRLNVGASTRSSDDYEALTLSSNGNSNGNREKQVPAWGGARATNTRQHMKPSSRLGDQDNNGGLDTHFSNNAIVDSSRGLDAVIMDGNEDVVNDEPLALAITGQALDHALNDPEAKKNLLTLALSCRVVVACRVSPGQKAAVVDLVKRGAKSDALGFAPVTLAIGDGANDVGMIQQAQIGVGISGHEGLQAVNASDFAIAQFRFLRRLLLVHGRWSYRRMAKVVLYSLYKNLVLVLVLFYYQAFSAFSGISLFESMVQAGYNFFLGMTPLSVGLFDREISARFALQNPQLYVSGRRNLNLNPVKLGWRVVEAFVHSAILFIVPISVADSNGLGVPATCDALGDMRHVKDGGSPDLYVLGTVTYTCLIFVMQYKIMFETSSFTRLNLLAWIFSFSLYFVFLLVYSGWFWEAPDFYWVAYCALGRPTSWLLILLCVVAAFVFDSAVRLARLMFRPHAVDILIERDRLADKLLHVHEQRKRLLGENGSTTGRESRETDISVLIQDQARGFGQRVKNALDINHHELMQRVHSLTEADLVSFGIDSPSLRSSFDFSVADRLNHSRLVESARPGRDGTTDRDERNVATIV